MNQQQQLNPSQRMARKVTGVSNIFLETKKGVAARSRIAKDLLRLVPGPTGFNQEEKMMLVDRSVRLITELANTLSQQNASTQKAKQLPPSYTPGDMRDLFALQLLNIARLESPSWRNAYLAKWRRLQTQANTMARMLKHLPRLQEDELWSLYNVLRRAGNFHVPIRDELFFALETARFALEKICSIFQYRIIGNRSTFVLRANGLSNQTKVTLEWILKQAGRGRSITKIATRREIAKILILWGYPRGGRKISSIRRRGISLSDYPSEQEINNLQETMLKRLRALPVDFTG